MNCHLFFILFLVSGIISVKSFSFMETSRYIPRHSLSVNRGVSTSYISSYILNPNRGLLMLVQNDNRKSTHLFSNADMFGSTVAPVKPPQNEVSKENGYVIQTQSADKLKLEAQRLRKEAAELEMALREEAREKGLPEDVINKLIPIRGATPTKTAEEAPSATPVIELNLISPDELKTKLGFLNTADPIKYVTDLQRIKMKGFLQLWDSYVPDNEYKVNPYQLKSKTNIDPKTLQIDEVGYDYRTVIVASFAIGTILALSSSQIGGQIGFLMGYLSALIPIGVVGIGSIAPGLIGNVITYVNSIINEDMRERLVAINVAKFLVGYTLGLPISKFDSSNIINSVEFYQFKPNGEKADKARLYFSRKNYSQEDIARFAIVCMCGSVSEYLKFGKTTGNNAIDVNLLQNAMTNIEPSLNPDTTQNYIRWLILNSYDILKKYDNEFKMLVTAFKEKKSLEECIAIVEGKQ